MNRINLSALARSFFAFIPLSLVGASLITGEPPPATQEDHRITAIREVISSGDRELARARLHETVESLEPPKAGGEDARIELLHGLDRLAEELQSLQDSLQLRTAVLELHSRLLPSDHLDVLVAKNRLAETRLNLDDLDGARRLYEEVLADGKEVLSRDQLLRTKHDLAITSCRLGDLENSRNLLEEVLGEWMLALSPEDRNLLLLKQNLAAIKLELGDPEGARRILEEVLSKWMQILPADHRDLVLAKHNLALTRFELGDIEGAHELIKDVIEARTRTLSPDHPDLLRVKENFALVKLKLGDAEGAQAILVEVLAARAHLPADHPEVLLTKHNLAVTRSRLGDLESARLLGEEVLATKTRILPTDHPDLLKAKESLAATRKRLGDYEGARPLEEEVLAARTRLLPADHPGLLEAKGRLARTKACLGDLAGTRELLCSLFASMRSRAQSLRVESPRAAREGARAELDRISRVLFLCEAVDSAETLRLELFAAVESLRQASGATGEIALALVDRPELAELQRTIAKERGLISDLVASGPSENKDLENWKAELSSAILKRDRLEWSLRADLAKAGVSAETIEPGALAKALPSDAAAISYLRYRRWSLADPRMPPEDSMLAFLVQPDARVERVELGPAKQLEELVLAWRDSLSQPGHARGLEIEKSSAKLEEANELGRRLRACVLDPVLGLAPKARSLYVVRDDILHLVPLEALPLEEGLVGERYTVYDEISFGRLIQPDRRNDAQPKMLLAGGIDYEAEHAVEGHVRLDATTPPLEASGLERSAVAARFKALPAASEEIESIASLFEECFETKALLMEGAAASKAALAEEAKGARFLHLATHGWFAPEVFRSQLDGEEDAARRESFFEAAETIRGFAPETLCGLALAGANRGRDSIGRVPGILTAEELSMLDLRSCELAVLSACETSAGIRRAGQSMQSLQTALHSAGARTAITSLWKVDDAATRRLFEIFYAKLWREKLGKHQALWQAKMALRAEGHPPRAWAGWTLTGDPK